MVDLLINSFVVFFVVIDPIGLSAIFAALTRGYSREARRRVALHGVVLSTVILVLFFFAGDWFLQAMGIEVAAFRMAGGLLLLLLSVDMVFARQSGLRSTTSGETAEAEIRQDISVFPLAFPLIAGPGALTTVLLMTAQPGGATVSSLMLGIIILVLAITWAMLLFAEQLYRVLGETGTNMISRVLGVVLAALAVQFIVDGAKAAFW
ncbi:MAG: MarC family protein [Thiohalomonadaceae bacterium]